jgi:hypothetical protein
VELAYRELAAGSSAPDGAPSLAALPPGRYWVVRCPRQPAAVPYVLLGNGLVEAGMHQRSLLADHLTRHAVVVGAAGTRPRLDRPLIGVALSGYGGLSDGGVAFLSLALGGDPAGSACPGQDLMLVLPATGDLLVSWSRTDGPEWEAHAETLARQLCEPPGPTRLDFRFDSDRVAALRVEREEIPAIQAVHMGRGVELCAAGERALVIDEKVWSVSERSFARLPDREPAWDFLEPYLSWEEGSLARAGVTDELWRRPVTRTRSRRSRSHGRGRPALHGPQGRQERHPLALLSGTPFGAPVRAAAERAPAQVVTPPGRSPGTGVATGGP